MKEIAQFLQDYVKEQDDTWPYERIQAMLDDVYLQIDKETPIYYTIEYRHLHDGTSRLHKIRPSELQGCMIEEVAIELCEELEDVHSITDPDLTDEPNEPVPDTPAA